MTKSVIKPFMKCIYVIRVKFLSTITLSLAKHFLFCYTWSNWIRKGFRVWIYE